MVNTSIFALDRRSPRDFEIVERKGLGHPDTLADNLAEHFSRVYSKYTLSHLGAILHHNFDKVGILGGESHVSFGEGHLTKPIRVLINGRASVSFGNEALPVRQLLESAARDFLLNRFPDIDAQEDIKIAYNLSTASSPGKVAVKHRETETRRFMFKPRGLQDLRELFFLGSNDTSVGASYAPLSPTEKLVLGIENFLNSRRYKQKNAFLGSDIKVMACTTDRCADLTICVPQIAKYVPDPREYQDNIERIKSDLGDFIQKQNHDLTHVGLHINTKDRMDLHDIYLTAIGSSIESGDEGLVGRGNRVNGLITPCRPMAIEGAAGKNPVYHVGKLYNIAAQRIAQELHAVTNKEVEVYLLSQNGRPLVEPWKSIVAIQDPHKLERATIQEIVDETLKKIPELKHAFLSGAIDIS